MVGTPVCCGPQRIRVSTFDVDALVNHPSPARSGGEGRVGAVVSMHRWASRHALAPTRRAAIAARRPPPCAARTRGDVGSLEGQGGRVLDLLQGEPRADAPDPPDARQVPEQETLVGAEGGHYA